MQPLEGHAPSCGLNFGRYACDCKLTLERVNRELEELAGRHTAVLSKVEERLAAIEWRLRLAGIIGGEEP